MSGYLQLHLLSVKKSALLNATQERVLKTGHMGTNYKTEVSVQYLTYWENEKKEKPWETFSTNSSMRKHI